MIEGPQVVAVLERWAASWVHDLGLCSPACHGEGSRKRKGLDPLAFQPSGEWLFLAPGDADGWAARALRQEGIAVGFKLEGRSVSSIAIDLTSGRWASFFEWTVP